MLHEMTVDNFNYRIPRSGENDSLERLVVLVNMLAEEMKEAILHAGYVNPKYTYNYLVSIVFVLDSSFVIKSFTPEVPDILQRSTVELIGISYDTLISEDSKVIFNDLKKDLLFKAEYTTTLQLFYLTPEQLLVPSFCFISRLAATDDILICSVATSIKEYIETQGQISDVLQKSNGTLRSADVQLIQNVYDYILNHLDTPLPSLQELSRIFSVNNFKLKRGFRQFFGTSIYQLYNNERLKRAHILIEQSSLPLKEIAYQSGFGNYDNFSKAFKKKFNYSPTNVKRQIL